MHGLAIDAEDALLEYLESFYHLGFAGRALDKFGATDFATSIAPGLRDVLLTGKVYEAVRRQAKGLDDAYDAVVLDAPPTGRIAQFLNIHEAVSGLAKVGPIRNQADSINTMLRAVDHSRAPGHPARGHAGDRDRGGDRNSSSRPRSRSQAVIANMVRSMPLSRRGAADLRRRPRDAVGARLRRRPRTRRSPRSSPIEATRTLDHRRRRTVLDGFGTTVAEVAFDPAASTRTPSSPSPTSCVTRSPWSSR